MGYFDHTILLTILDGPMGRDFMMVDDDETSLHRKYGYAIMALSVVVLAVLMVSHKESSERWNI